MVEYYQMVPLQIKDYDLYYRKFKKNKKNVCYFCAYDSNLCRRTLPSLQGESDTSDCDQTECPTKKSWLPWIDLSICNSTCGGGTQLRRRECESGKNCFGESLILFPCNTEECQWNWTQWSGCSKICGGGTMNRTRECPEENRCKGDNEEIEDCNTEECQWSNWTLWSG